MNALLTRVSTATILIGLLWAALFYFPVIVSFGLLCLVVCVAACELLTMFAAKFVHALFVLCIMVGAWGVLLYMPSFMIMDALVLVFFAQLVCRKGCAIHLKPLVTWAITAMYALCLVFAMVSIINLYLIDPRWVVAVIGITALSDTGGYFVGKRWGQHKLCVMISPGKTWQGAFGGLLFVLLATVVVSYYSHLQFIMASIVALAVAVAAVMGDLLESWLKRVAGVKDSGHILPGHGGVLDRIDGLVVSAPVFLYLLRYFGKL
jgi:phosphatidate cytidylyltransferase